MSIQIRQVPLDQAHRSELVWQRIAEQACAWMALHNLPARDCIVLLPFAQHLPLARRAWMAQGGWPPRLETSRTLAHALGPETMQRPGEISFDLATDQLSAAELLQGQAWAGTWRRRDARGFQLAVARLVEAAHLWARAAAQRAPDQRDQFWAQARKGLTSGGPGEMERALARIALEWAAAGSTSPVTDRLFELKPAGLVMVQAGGIDPLCSALAERLVEQGSRALVLDTDLQLDCMFEQQESLGAIELALCRDFEDEAQCTAAAVLGQVNQGRVPVALIAQDRMLLRRVRALLDRAGVALADETGWTLSTMPAAAQIMALLRAAQGDAGLDDCLNWLKCDISQHLVGGESSLMQFEAKCRSQGWRRSSSVQPALLAPASARMWQDAQTLLRPLQRTKRCSLSEWLQGLRSTLEQMQAWQVLEDAMAGRQVMEALWLHRAPWPGSAQQAAQQTTQLNLSEFTAWVDHCLESQQFVPQLGALLPQVHITPLARAMLRPFAAIVLPGADAQTLGAVGAAGALISEPLAQSLGLPTMESRRDAQTRAFAQLLRAPVLILLRRCSEGAASLSASPLLERLQEALKRANHVPMKAWQDSRVSLAVAALPTPRAAAQAKGRLPQTLSASAVDSLRACPYQFFSRVMLGLKVSDELEAAVEKRDYGTWLHGVLFDFHRWRVERPSHDERTLMDEAAQAQMQALGLDAAEFLPFACSFQRFVPRYLEWLREHEARGAMWAEGELLREVQPLAWQGGALAGIVLRGRLDRIDLLSGSDGMELLLLDYKTGSVKSLKDKVAKPLEDSQLAVYAALMDAQPLEGVEANRPLRAVYLALDDAHRIEQVEHEHPLQTSQAMLVGLGQDLLSMHAGQALSALGEGEACDYCEARGLCRRDDWLRSAEQGLGHD